MPDVRVAGYGEPPRRAGAMGQETRSCPTRLTVFASVLSLPKWRKVMVVMLWSDGSMVGPLVWSARRVGQ